jgi:hypothetical protein
MVRVIAASLSPEKPQESVMVFFFIAAKSNKNRPHEAGGFNA